VKYAFVCFALAGFTAASAHATCPAFSTPANYIAQNDPRSVTVADVNGDGRPDLVVANQDSDSVSVFLAQAGGTFAAPANYVESGATPLSVAVGDVNGDGRVDLVIANCGSKNLSIRFGGAAGNGAFSGPAHIGPLGDCPFPIKLGDVNADGKLDIVTITDGKTVNVYRGNGAGVFGVPATYSAGKSPASVAIADFNGDGKNDLAIGNGSGTDVSVLLNVGDGTFTAAIDYPSGGQEVRSVAAADLNGDGKIDLALGNGGTTTVGILLGNGNGTFRGAVTYAVSGSPWSLAAADLNSDGRLDLVAADVFKSVSLLIGNGDGTFQPFIDINGGESPRDLAVADVDGDGRADVVIANGDVGHPASSKNYVSVVLNKCGWARREGVRH